MNNRDVNPKASEENRTLINCLEGNSFTIKLNSHPSTIKLRMVDCILQEYIKKNNNTNSDYD